MWQALKARDLQRDPRYALHTGSDDPPDWKGDAKLAGVVEEITDEATVTTAQRRGAPRSARRHLFRLDLSEVSHVALNDAGRAIVITSWTPERGVKVLERA